MSAAVRLWLVVALSYLLVRFGVRGFASGGWQVDQEFLAHLLIVPVAQTAILLLLGRWLLRRPSP